MNNVIKKIKNGGFKVVSTSYNIPVEYVNDKQLQSGVERRELPNHTAGYSFYRDNGC